MTVEGKHLNFRPPTTSSVPQGNFTPPAVSFLRGTWHVTHSSLPMWKKNKNVKITYTPLPDNADLLDDLVEYQPTDSTKQKKVEGIDTPHTNTKGAYQWRGKGWLKFVTSHWQVLGYGEEDGGWAVTYFQKTLFTPAGIDVYARQKGGLSDGLLDQIKAELKAVQDPGVQSLAESIFSIKHEV
jgi:hypothetical protein